ncbi:MAG: hypothetical protein ACO3B3_03605 [Cyanobium sp.]
MSAFDLFSAAGPASSATGDTCWFGATTTGYSFPICDATFSFDPVLDKTLTVSTYPTVGKGTVQFSRDEDLNFMVDVVFQPSTGKSLFATTAGLFEYNLAITGSDQNFDTARLSATTSSQTTFVKKTIQSDTPTLALESIGGTPDQRAFTNRSLTFISVRDTYSVSDGSLKGFQNSFTQADRTIPEESAPGPLPLFGAGAALGFSRRIRGRIRHQRQAMGRHRHR